jgi:hypothetical protein
MLLHLLLHVLLHMLLLASSRAPSVVLWLCHSCRVVVAVAAGERRPMATALMSAEDMHVHWHWALGTLDTGFWVL